MSQILNWPMLYIWMFWTVVLVFSNSSLSLFLDQFSAHTPVKKSCHKTELINSKLLLSSCWFLGQSDSIIAHAIPSPYCAGHRLHLAWSSPWARLVDVNVETVRFPCWTWCSSTNPAFIFQTPQRCLLHLHAYIAEGPALSCLLGLLSKRRLSIKAASQGRLNNAKCTCLVCWKHIYHFSGKEIILRCISQTYRDFLDHWAQLGSCSMFLYCKTIQILHKGDNGGDNETKYI